MGAVCVSEEVEWVAGADVEDTGTAGDDAGAVGVVGVAGVSTDEDGFVGETTCSGAEFDVGSDGAGEGVVDLGGEELDVFSSNFSFFFNELST